METVVNEVLPISKQIGYADLLGGDTSEGTHDPITIHEILPEGWRVMDVEVETSTAFNGSGTRALDIGVTGNGDAIVDGLDVKAAAYKDPTVVPYRATSSIALIANLITATDIPTAGEVLITLHLVQVKRED